MRITVFPLNICLPGIDTMTIYVHQSEFEEYEQSVIAGIHRAVNPDTVEMESDLALLAVVGRGMRATRGTAARIFSALAMQESM